MTEVSKQIVMIGLPAAGKTSYLAALWYLCQHKQVEHRLEVKQFQGDMKYLNQIADKWSAFEEIPRTTTSTERTVSMLLNDKTTSNTFTLTVPDLSGETFVSQLVARQFTEAYDEFLQGSLGALLFVSPLDYRKPARISAAKPLMEEIGATPGDEKKDDSRVEWDPEKMTPTQVQLVELLQFIADRPYFKRPFRLALVISAWDALLEEKKTPVEWLTEELPLLSQFLESNRALFDYTVYGISAQGDNYKNTDKLVGKLPSQRIIVAGDEVKNDHDLTELLTWLMR